MASNQIVPIAIIGLGFGRWILKALTEAPLNTQYQVVALCDLDTTKAHELAAPHGARVLTLEEILADVSIPAVGLFTGPVGRAGLLRKLIRAGKHVMTTKPFERDLEAARDILMEAQTLERAIYLNSPAPRLADDLAQITRWQEEFQLGQALAAYANMTARYNEVADGTWLDDPEQCPVAPIFRLGIYLINDLVELFGEAESVQVMCSRIFTQRPTPDHAQLSLRFAGGGLASIMASFCLDDADFWRNRLILNFENGTVYRNFGSEALRKKCVLSLVGKGRDGKASELAQAEFTQMSGEYPWEDFYTAVTAKPPAYTDPGKVLAGLRVIEAMRRAANQPAQAV